MAPAAAITLTAAMPIIVENSEIFSDSVAVTWKLSAASHFVMVLVVFRPGRYQLPIALRPSLSFGNPDLS